MFEPIHPLTSIDRLHARRVPAALRRANPNGDKMSTTNNTAQCRRPMRRLVALFAFVLRSFLSFVALLGFTTTEALACACGCSVFDVGGLDTPQEQDHGGRVFFEFWGSNQTQNYVGSSRAPAALNSDKNINTQWYNVGFSYNFNRDWGVIVRIPTTNRDLTTETDIAYPAR